MSSTPPTRRVLLVFEPPDGGVPENVAELAMGLAAHGWRAEVAGPPEASVYPALRARGVPIHRLPLRRGYGRPDTDARALRVLISLLAGSDFELVHAHSSKAGVLGRLAALVTGTPSLYSPHCFAFIGALAPAWRMWAKGVERALGHLPGGQILCVCHSEREEGIRAHVAPASRLHVIHNGCPPSPEQLEPDPALAALAACGPLAGAVAALREQKHLDLLIDAAPLVFARLPEARIAIVGNGPLRGALEQHAARLGLDREERFALLPFTPPAARALAALDVFVLPSAWEAFPIGLLEALACGVPQVACDVGGSREAISPETGALVPPDDALALAEAIVALLADRERRARAAEASRRRHAEHFGLAQMLAATAALYEATASPSAI